MQAKIGPHDCWSNLQIQYTSGAPYNEQTTLKTHQSKKFSSDYRHVELKKKKDVHNMDGWWPQKQRKFKKIIIL